MCTYFDLKRIEELQTVLGADTQKILTSMLASMTKAIEQAESAVAPGELGDATAPAHRVRRDALMLGAEQLQTTLTELEAATRDYDEARAAKRDKQGQPSCHPGRRRVRVPPRDWLKIAD